MTNTLATLNALRTRADMKPLKAWKESKAKLEAAIAKLTPATVKEQLKASVEMNGTTVTIAEIARELGLNPKVCRARCRRQIDEIVKLTDQKVLGEWKFAASSRPALIAFLTK